MGWLVKGIFRYISGIFHSIFRFFIRYISGIFRAGGDFSTVYFGIFRIYFIVYFGVCRGIFQRGMGILAAKRGCQHESFILVKQRSPPLAASCPMQACARVLGVCA